MAELCVFNVSAGVQDLPGYSGVTGKVFINYSITNYNDKAVIQSNMAGTIKNNAYTSNGYLQCTNTSTPSTWTIGSTKYSVTTNKTIAASGAGATKTDVIGTTSNLTINKTHTTQTINVTAYYHYMYVVADGYGLTWTQRTVTGTISIGAKTSYTVTFNANSGSGAPSAQTKWYGETLTLSSTKPTRTGYTFLGWSTSSTATSATYAAGGSYTANSAATLYAVWKLNTYSVTYDANGGSEAPANQTKEYGTNLTLTTTKPTRSGYTFSKWNTKSDGSGTSYNSGGTYSANAAVTLYAIWTANKFTITYNANGGIIADSPHAWVSNDNTYLFKVNNSIIQRTGANNTTYTDTWYSVSYNSTFNLYNYTTMNISRVGYHIDAATAWNTKADGSGTSYNQDTDYTWTTLGSLTATTTNVTLCANWKPNPYTLTFNPNGGQCDTASKTVNYEQAYGTLPTPTRDGYTFDGWFTETSGGTQISADTIMRTIDGTTVYAHWTPITYYISYTLQGGTNHPNNPGSYNIEQTPFTLNAPTRNDYTFIGWTNNTYINPTLSVTIPESSFGDYSFTANWHQNYFVPTLVSQSFVVKRCDRDGNDAVDGTYFHIEFSWQPGRSYTYNPSNGEISDDTEVAPDRYTIIITDQTDPENSQTYDNILVNAVIDDTTHTYSNTKVSQAFDSDFFEENISLERIVIEETKTYDVQLILYKDEASSTTIHPTETASSFISKSYFCIDINSDGTAIGFGTSVKDGDDADEGMHVDMDITLRDERDFYIMVDESSNNDQLANILDALGWLTATSNIGE